MSWIDQITFDERGLVPVMAQDARTGEVLMLAWANREALEQTASTGRATYWSRSRASLWVVARVPIGFTGICRGVRADLYQAEHGCSLCWFRDARRGSDRLSSHGGADVSGRQDRRNGRAGLNANGSGPIAQRLIPTGR